MKKQICIILISICLLASVGAAAVAAMESDEGRLTINSDPDGADVWVSGKFVGYAPVSVIVPGDAMINLRVEIPGNTYDIWRGSAYVPAGQDVSMTVPVSKKTEHSKDFGIVVVSSNAEDAEVYMDNSYYGKISGGSLSIDNAKLGLHYVQVKKDGYDDYAMMVDVKPKNLATANVVADLKSTAGAVTTTTAAAGSTVPAAPTKAPVCALLPVLALLGAAAVVRR
ncbi:PEGA domain-containing protein [Methanorbis furvi]|uniref:PEGA domain-containing protein n=1 Tax=Methanorbis furvi TaxID=3028299 RepID=A0AAE4SC04_9EURY|nr:hypothetical protein [Methanocorpusculaceae archaeon Ag1]